MNYFKYTAKKTIRLITKKGYEIEGTRLHKIFSDKKWKELSSLKIGDRVTLSEIVFKGDYQRISFPLFYHKWMKPIGSWSDNAPSVLIDENWGRFLGLVMGDGHMSQVGVMVSCNIRDKEVIDWIVSFAESIGCSVVTRRKFCHHANKETNGIDIKITSRPLQRFLMHIGLAKHKRKYSVTKNFEVPDIIFRSPKTVIQAFLGGLFEADGTINKAGNCIDLCSKSKKLIQQMQILLLGFGIKSRIKKRRAKLRGWDRGRTYYFLCLNKKSVNLFKKKIGFMSDFKNARFPEDESINTNADDWDLTDEIVSIQNRTADVYDIEVDCEHHYIGNGIVSHNSSNKAVEAQLLYQLPIMSNLQTYKGCSPMGIYSENNDKAWYEAMRLACRMQKTEYDERIVANRKFAEDHFDIKNNVSLWEEHFNKLLEAKK